MDLAFSPTLSASCVDRRVLLKSRMKTHVKTTESNRIEYHTHMLYSYVCESEVAMSSERNEESKDRKDACAELSKD